jgi:hypothetical protein
MGLVYAGVPHDLVIALQSAAHAVAFIETGTYEGATAAWAARYFERVITIEAAEELHRQAQARHAALRNVDFRLGDSRRHLPEILGQLRGPAIIWLDSHWSGGVTYGSDDECPLVDELGLIAAAPGEHVILIDDARLFLAPPPAPHSIDAWPTIGEVLAALPGTNRYTIVLQDVIVSVPDSLQTVVQTYARAVADEAWQQRRTSGPVRRALRRVVSALQR